MQRTQMQAITLRWAIGAICWILIPAIPIFCALFRFFNVNDHSSTALDFTTHFCEKENGAWSVVPWISDFWSTLSLFAGVLWMIWEWKNGDGQKNTCTWWCWILTLSGSTAYHAFPDNSILLTTFLVGTLYPMALLEKLPISTGNRASGVAAIWVARLATFVVVLTLNDKETVGLSLFFSVSVLTHLFNVVVFFLLLSSSDDHVRKHLVGASILGLKNGLQIFEPLACHHSYTLGVLYHSFWHVAVAYSCISMSRLADALDQEKISKKTACGDHQTKRNTFKKQLSFFSRMRGNMLNTDTIIGRVFSTCFSR